MACCQKRRKEQVKQLMKRRLFEIEGFSTLKLLKKNPPRLLHDKLILDYHRKTHMLYKNAIKHKPLNRVFINQIVELHDEFVKEMLTRDIEHKNPIQRI